MDVMRLQELSDEPDPHATLPFISHHTLNISRDLEDGEERVKSEEMNELAGTRFVSILWCPDGPGGE